MSHSGNAQKTGFSQSAFVGLYARVSTHDQQTLPLQIRAMREIRSQARRSAPARRNGNDAQL
jgi:hypothetical protein